MWNTRSTHNQSQRQGERARNLAGQVVESPPISSALCQAEQGSISSHPGQLGLETPFTVHLGTSVPGALGLVWVVCVFVPSGIMLPST